MLVLNKINVGNNRKAGSLVKSNVAVHPEAIGTPANCHFTLASFFKSKNSIKPKSPYIYHLLSHQFIYQKTMNKLINKINTFCFSLENRLGLLASCLIIGLIILGFDMLYITPKFELAYHWLQYSILSNNPFDFTTTIFVRYRILPSFLGYITFLRGNLFVVVPLIFSLLFISAVYYMYRKKKYVPVDALLFTGLIAFSCTLYIQLTAPGYTDTAFYFFIFLSFAFISNVFKSALFFALALLTHESCLFLLPGLLFYAYYVSFYKKDILKYLLAYSISIIPLLLYRNWVSGHVHVEFDLDFYFSEKNIHFAMKRVLPLIPAGAFYAFKLFWFFPIYAMYKSWQRKEYKFIILISIILICNFAQLAIAFDITRMLCLGFPAILLSAEKIKTSWSSSRFTKFALGLTLINFLILQNYVSADGLIPMLPLPYTSLVNFLVGI